MENFPFEWAAGWAGLGWAAGASLCVGWSLDSWIQARWESAEEKEPQALRIKFSYPWQLLYVYVKISE